jgi:hypothetical protein
MEPKQKTKEDLEASLLPSEGNFYQSKLNNPNILHIETVKQGCNI